MNRGGESSGVRVASVGDVELAYETFGDPGNPPIVLIHGLATQMLGWPDELCADLAGRGHFVVRFDNRDVGLSTHLHGAPRVRMTDVLLRRRDTAPYTLSHMAGDTVGLLDVLGLDSAHLVGASMGGAIAQTIALEHPGRVRSLTSIMSTTGHPRIGRPRARAFAALMARRPRSRKSAIDRVVANYRIIGSPGYEFDEAAVRERAERAYDRAHDPEGVMRQLAAVSASRDRTWRLGAIRVPTLVLHGREDPLATLGGGVATANAIKGSELVVFDGMGHDLPRELWPQIADRICDVVRRGEEAVARGRRTGLTRFGWIPRRWRMAPLPEAGGSSE